MLVSNMNCEGMTEIFSSLMKSFEFELMKIKKNILLKVTPPKINHAMHEYSRLREKKLSEVISF